MSFLLLLFALLLVWIIVGYGYNLYLEEKGDSYKKKYYDYLILGPYLFIVKINVFGEN